jgi:hypothetical protein
MTIKPGPAFSKSPSRPSQREGHQHTKPKVEATLFVWICNVVDVVKQNVWICTEAPLPPFGGGRRRERPYYHGRASCFS